MLVLRDLTALTDHMLNVRYGREYFKNGKRTAHPKPPVYPYIEYEGVRHIPPAGRNYLFLLSSDTLALQRFRSAYVNRCRRLDQQIGPARTDYLLKSNHMLLLADHAYDDGDASLEHEFEPSFRETSLSDWRLLSFSSLLSTYWEGPHATWQFRAVIYDPHEVITTKTGARLPDSFSLAHLRASVLPFPPIFIPSNYPFARRHDDPEPFEYHPDLGLVPIVQRVLCAGSPAPFRPHFPPLPRVTKRIEASDGEDGISATCDRCDAPIFHTAFAAEGVFHCLLCADPGKMAVPARPVSAVAAHLAGMPDESLELLAACCGPPLAPRLYRRSSGGYWSFFSVTAVDHTFASLFDLDAMFRYPEPFTIVFAYPCLEKK